MADFPEDLDRPRIGGGRRWRWVFTALLVAAVFVVLYYPIGMMLTHRVDDDVDFAAPAELTAEGGSGAVAIAAALIDREVNKSTWVANKPFLFPASALDNMPNFQMGVVYAISRFAIEMTDVLGRTRGSGQVDDDLDHASGLLKYDGTIWMWEPATSLMPTASAEKQYRAGMKALLRYNARLAAGQAVYDRRADNLIAFLDRVAADLGSVSAVLDKRATVTDAGWFDTEADDIFYAAKGRLYAYYLIVREIGADFAEVLADKSVGNVWRQMTDNLRTAAALDPLIISNGANDGFLMPSHLATQGFYLLRARTQLREVNNILLK